MRQKQHVSIFSIDIFKKNDQISDGFPVSRGCKTKEKISVKTRDCENQVNGAMFERTCYCRKRLCNLGYDKLLEYSGAKDRNRAVGWNMLGIFVYFALLLCFIDKKAINC